MCVDGVSGMWERTALYSIQRSLTHTEKQKKENILLFYTTGATTTMRTMVGEIELSSATVLEACRIHCESIKTY